MRCATTNCVVKYRVRLLAALPADNRASPLLEIRLLARGATRAEISYALAEINWKSLEISWKSRKSGWKSEIRTQ